MFLSSTICRLISTAALILAAVALHAGEAGAQAGVAQLVGSWGGSGRLTYTDGSSEAIRCSAYHSGGGSDLKMAIQCKSEKNPVHIRSTLRIAGGRVTGAWEERTFNASGTASGSIGSQSMSLSIGGSAFSGTMSVSFSRSSHSVNITTQGIGMSRATINFSRR